MFVSKFIDKILEPKIVRNIKPFGEFRYVETGSYWICFSETVFPGSNLEIVFEVENSDQDLFTKITLTKNLLQNIESLKEKIYNHIALNFSEKSIEKVKTMWFLSAICLENDNKTWKVVFEPDFDIETIFNHFLRFSILDSEITWSNLN